MPTPWLRVQRSLAILRIGGPINTREPGVLAVSCSPRPVEALAAELRQAQRFGATSVLIVGGEPTLRPDLPILLRAAHRLGLAPGIATNGRMLAYPTQRRQLLDAGLVYVRLSLHAADEDLHDSIVGVRGAFSQTVEGLRGILANDTGTCFVDVACVVTADNVNHLDTWTDLVLSLPGRSPRGLRFVAPTLASPESWPASNVIAHALLAAEKRARATLPNVVIAWEGFAPCQLESLSAQRDDHQRRPAIALGPEDCGSALPPYAPNTHRQGTLCQECARHATCPGAPWQLIETEGQRTVRPVPALRSNSFNYEFVRDLPGFVLRAGACSAPALRLTDTPDRAVLLARGDRVSLYETPTRDFSIDEIRWIKTGIEQVYFDTSPGATLQEFLSNVRRARFHDECLACPHAPACVRALRIDDALPFESEERWLRAAVSGLRGKVLDIGCGDHLYREQLRTLIQHGQVEYHGLDPDRDALSRFEASVPGANLHQGTIEDTVWDDNSFDEVLCLRSVNHFRDLTRALQSVARMLRPGARAILCDSPPFAMLRDPAQVTYADAHAPSTHEHFRNCTSQYVIDLLEGIPLRVEEHRPVSPSTSNEWLLSLRKHG